MKRLLKILVALAMLADRKAYVAEHCE